METIANRQEDPRAVLYLDQMHSQPMQVEVHELVFL